MQQKPLQGSTPENLRCTAVEVLIRAINEEYYVDKHEF